MHFLGGLIAVVAFAAACAAAAQDPAGELEEPGHGLSLVELLGPKRVASAPGHADVTRGGCAADPLARFATVCPLHDLEAILTAQTGMLDGPADAARCTSGWPRCPAYIRGDRGSENQCMATAMLVEPADITLALAELAAVCDGESASNGLNSATADTTEGGVGQPVVWTGSRDRRSTLNNNDTYSGDEDESSTDSPTPSPTPSPTSEREGNYDLGFGYVTDDAAENERNRNEAAGLGNVTDFQLYQSALALARAPTSTSTTAPGRSIDQSESTEDDNAAYSGGMIVAIVLLSLVAIGMAVVLVRKDARLVRKDARDANDGKKQPNPNGPDDPGPIMRMFPNPAYVADASKYAVPHEIKTNLDVGPNGNTGNQEHLGMRWNGDDEIML